jgi:hypothetical protein
MPITPISTPPTAPPLADATARSDAVAEASTWEAVAAWLGRPETHGLAEPIERIDTHAAVVFLAGSLAYKIKRPVRFPFLDFSTLALREAACRREIAIDRPIAPEIYRRVVAITREADGRPAIDGAGEPIEWAVEMNRFDAGATLDHVLARGPLPSRFVEDLAETVARAEARATIRDAGVWYADLRGYIEQNAAAFRDRPDLFPPHETEALERTSLARHAALTDLVETRGRRGRVRLGHGDLHAGNIAVVDGRPLLFDAIEFDDAIATGDVLYDAGFLVMDLTARGHRAEARAFLDRWLVEAVRAEVGRRGTSLDDPARAKVLSDVLFGEIDALEALPLWLSVRAGLRAKIAAATAGHLMGAVRAAKEAEARRFFDLAGAALAPATPRLVAIGGLSGSGKSTLAKALAPLLEPAPGALILRSDVLRKLLAGVRDDVHLPASSYTKEASARVYDLLVHAVSRALAAGRSVIADAVALKPAERARFAEIAEAVGMSFTGLWLTVDPEVAEARVGARVGDASDADAAVVAFQTGVDRGPLDWIEIDGSGTPETTLALARGALGLD